MPEFQVGDMWTVWDKTDLFLITGGGTLNGEGSLEMEHGLAIQAQARFPGIDRALGRSVAAIRPLPYLLLVSERWPVAKLGLFQVTLNGALEIDLSLILGSTRMLAQWCERYPAVRVALEYPDLGPGRAEVLPYLQRLPGTVTVWENDPVVAVAQELGGQVVDITERR